MAAIVRCLLRTGQTSTNIVSKGKRPPENEKNLTQKQRMTWSLFPTHSWLYILLSFIKEYGSTVV